MFVRINTKGLSLSHCLIYPRLRARLYRPTDTDWSQKYLVLKLIPLSVIGEKEGYLQGGDVSSRFVFYDELKGGQSDEMLTIMS